MCGAAEIANLGIQNSSDRTQFLLTVADDIVAGRGTPKTANRAIQFADRIGINAASRLGCSELHERLRTVFLTAQAK
jgi:hypothetical protein